MPRRLKYDYLYEHFIIYIWLITRNNDQCVNMSFSIFALTLNKANQSQERQNYNFKLNKMF